MKRVLFTMLVLVFMFAVVAPALAQDTVPVTPISAQADAPVEFDFTTIDAWIAMAVAVAGFVEVLKQSTLKPLRDALSRVKWFNEDTADQLYVSGIWLLSYALSYLLVVNLAAGKTLFDALDFPVENLLLAQHLTAAGVVLGEAFLHNVYDFVKLRAGLLPLLQSDVISDYKRS